MIFGTPASKKKAANWFNKAGGSVMSCSARYEPFRLTVMLCGLCKLHCNRVGFTVKFTVTGSYP